MPTHVVIDPIDFYARHVVDGCRLGLSGFDFTMIIAMTGPWPTDAYSAAHMVGSRGEM